MSTAKRISLYSVSLQVLRTGALQKYKDSLQDLFLESVKKFNKIEAGAFKDLRFLRTISIKQAPLLRTIDADVFKCSLPNLKILRITQTALQTVPDLQFLGTRNIIYMVDLDSNKIKTLSTGCVKMKTEILNLDYNAIEEIEDSAFDGSEIAKLSLRGNRNLQKIDDNAFYGLKNIRKIDLSDTRIKHLPVKGLEELEILKIARVYTLKAFPSVYNFKYIKEAYLTYPYHCCAFRFPDTHNPEEFSRYTAFKEDMESKYCKSTTTPLTENDNYPQVTYSDFVIPTLPGIPGDYHIRRLSSALQNTWGILSTSGKWSSSGSSEWGGITATDITSDSSHINNHPLLARKTSSRSNLIPLGKEVLDPENHKDSLKATGFNIFDGRMSPNGPVEGVFHLTTISFGSQVELQAFCGQLSKNYRDVECYPLPDAFNPCEDVMGNEFLRVVVWLVVVTSMMGNMAVMIVLMSTGVKSNVSKFLMCNLAFADFCMGSYLMMIAAMDLHSIGTYFNYAIYWQHGFGCQAAGFLTVFATELSIFTLTVISVERWYAITNAINLHKRLSMGTAAKVMAGGWVYALTMAVLPLVEINGYTRTSICLPMENRDSKDFIYLATLLTINSCAFVFIFFCYGNMYASVIRHQNKAAANDMSVAKRMALLVITDFICWAPVAFFAMTALGGYPLIDVTKSKILLVFFYPLNSCANPFLYAIFTTQYRRDCLMLIRRFGYKRKCTKKHDDTISCNVPPVYRSVGSKTQCNSPSTQIYYENCKARASLKFEPISRTVDGPVNSAIGSSAEDSIQLWSLCQDTDVIKNRVRWKNNSCFKNLNSKPDYLPYQGSPHPVKNRVIHLSDQDEASDDLSESHVTVC